MVGGYFCGSADKGGVRTDPIADPRVELKSEGEKPAFWKRGITFNYDSWSSDFTRLGEVSVTEIQ